MAIGDDFPKQRKVSRRVKRNKSEQIAAFIGAKKRPRGRAVSKKEISLARNTDFKKVSLPSIPPVVHAAKK